jgi:Zinc carboxypeptidase
MRRAALLVLALFAAATPAADAACTKKTAYDPKVPTLQKVAGFVPGTRPATDAQVDRYLAAVDAASTRVKTVRVATSAGGRPITAAFVSLPAQLAKSRLDALSTGLRKLRSGRPSEAEARKFASKQPAVAWIAGGVHGNEPSGADASLRLLYDLAARTDCANEARLKNLVTVLLPVQNPDGRAADERANSAGFDLNRDWFAMTQPELSGKVALLERFPPVMYVDSHEERTSSFFFPPNADPIYHEVPPRALDAIAKVFSPALRSAFGSAGFAYETRRTYDLFFTGYGDSAPTIAFGAAGMTFEKGALSPFADRFAQMYLAHSAALGAASAGRKGLVESWAAGWREARAEGAKGRLRPNRLLSGARATRKVSSERVFAYALRDDASESEAARLVARLRTFGVSVQRLAKPATVTLRRWGTDGAATTTLPAGTYWVSMAQGTKHWIQALLNDDSYVPIRFFSDVTAWSNPLLMGVEGGAVETRTAPAGLEPAPAPDLGSAPAAPAAAYAFRTDSTGALALIGELLRGGVAVRRDGARAIVPGSADLTALRAAAKRLQVPVSGLDADPGGGTGLVNPVVAVLSEASTEDGAATSLGWTRFVLSKRLGLPVSVVTQGQIAAGALGSANVIVVPDAPGAQPLPAPVLAQIAAVVGRGGTYVGVRDRGVDVARAAGLSTTTASRPVSLLVPGSLLGVSVDTGDPLGLGMAPAGFAFDADDPLLAAPSGARVPVRYPSSIKVSGFAEGTDRLAGTAAALVDGRTALFAFDPSYRGYAEWGQRLLGNAVLLPPTASASAARLRRPVNPALLPARSPSGPQRPLRP